MVDDDHERDEWEGVGALEVVGGQAQKGRKFGDTIQTSGPRLIGATHWHLERTPALVWVVRGVRSLAWPFFLFLQIATAATAATLSICSRNVVEG